MYTRGTKHFGAWKEGRRENVWFKKISIGFFTFTLVLSSFAFLLVYIICLETTQEFYITQIQTHLFPTASETLKKNGFLFSERSSAINVMVSKNKNDKIYFLFDDGNTFEIDDKKLIHYMNKKRKNIIISAMLIRQIDSSVSRIKLWTDKSITFNELSEVTKFYSEYGFDDFDFALKR